MIPLAFERLSPEDQFARSRAFLDKMATRRTIRRFSSEPIPIEVIENCVAAASTAPSGANLQPWTFVVVSNAELKAKLREAAEKEEKENYERRMTPEWLEALEPFGTDWHKPHFTDCPYIVVLFEQMHHEVTDSDGKTQLVKHYYTKESVGIALGMFVTALHEAGIASLIHTPSPMGFLREILQRPKSERAFVVIPVGYPADDCVVPDITKKPLDAVMVHFD